MMNKNFIIYLVVFGVFYVLGVYTHSCILENKGIKLVFSLQNIYLFHALFSLMVCVVFKILSKNHNILQQLGYIYLGTLFLKIIVFSILFYNPIFTTENLEKTQSISLLIPIAIFLSLEVFFIAKIISKNHSIK